jgi:hypothetical protein
MEVAQRIWRLAASVGVIFVTGALVAPAFGQEDSELRLTVRRTFGYRGGDQIQGRFALGVEGPDNLVQVTFLIDDEVMVEDQAPPFEYGFHTGEYTPGPHRLMAIGRLASGVDLRTAERSFEFVTAEASWAAAGRIVVPLLFGVLGLILAATLVLVLFSLKSGKRSAALRAAAGSLEEAEGRSRSAGQPQVEAGQDQVSRLIDESRFES